MNRSVVARRRQLFFLNRPRRPLDEYNPHSPYARQVAHWRSLHIEGHLGYSFGLTAAQVGYLLAIRDRIIREEVEAH